MAFRKPQLQRSLLFAEETPTTQFIEDFRVSHRLRKSLNLERKSSAPEQVRFLKLREQQQAYVVEARQRELPPIDRIVANQVRLCELRRDAHHLGPKAAESPAQLDTRMAKRDAFLASRKFRHDEACEKFNRGLDKVNDECELSINGGMKRIKEYIAKTDGQIVELLSPLQTESLPLQTDTDRDLEDEIKCIVPQIDRVIEDRRVAINKFQSVLEEIDKFRKKEAESLLAVLAESLRHTSHMSLEEVGKFVEERSADINNLIVESQKAARTLTSNLTIETLEKSKEYKKQWHAGLLLWREKQPKPQVDEVDEEQGENDQ
jgi:hypothetical protein